MIHPIHITGDEAGWGNPLSDLVSSRRVIILTTAKVMRPCFPLLKKELGRLKINFTTLSLPDGEKYKNLKTVEEAHRGLVRLKADRNSLILLLGGGVLGDLGGFVAATFLRGVPFVQIPTTLVAQVDSSIGGKLGVNLPEGKNLVGLFQQPTAVLAHIPFLKTLPEREIRGGLAEVLKYGVIEDEAFFRLVVEQREKIFERDLSLLLEMVKKSSAIKANVVAQDERETTGLRLILNFGHTFGHAIERLTRYRRFLHGEAVGMGMVMASRISHRLGFCSQGTADQIEQGVKQVGLPVNPPSFSKAEWRDAITVDKKSRGGKIRFVFVKGVGQVVVESMTPEELVKAL